MTKLDLSLTGEEIDAYLASQRTIRLATVAPSGVPHVVPLWFVWTEHKAFMNTTLGNVTVRNIERDPRATGCVDDGPGYDDLRGVLLHGRVERADDDPLIPEAEQQWSEKYLAGAPVPFRLWRNRAWFRLAPNRITSWDFRKIPEARAKAGRG